MNLVAIPAFADNHIRMMNDGRGAFVVDPGDAAPVQAAPNAAHLALVGILVRPHRAGCAAERAAGNLTRPSTIDREHRIPSFLRCSEPGPIAAGRREGAIDDSPVDVFAALREWKNRFR